jgi:hypothetical protein
MKRLILIFILIFLNFQVFAQQASKQVPQQLALQAYGNLPQVSMVRISPTGKNVALRYTRGEQDIILVRDISTGKRLGVVNVSKMQPNHIYFIDDHRLILKASQHNNVYNFRGRHDISSAFILNVEKNDIRQLLTQGDGIYNCQTGLGGLVGLSPDKQYAYMPAYVGSRNKTSGEPIMTLMKVNLNKKRRRYR